MKKRHPNYRLVKTNRSYTVEEIANTLGVHKNTVRGWVKSGLPAIDDDRPMLIHGPALSAFLKTKRAKHKRPCAPGEIYCVRCRAPKVPAGDMAEYQPKTATLGNLVAICPDCNAIMNRRTNLSTLEQFRCKIDITIPQALEHIVESN